ncbi:hypothetical protein HZS55_12990 [Halosimplex rubrum]|uniref:Uncharacterized protein n=1 Tax=Halosimplex rubrum TaxID=869889 RepID=A0A7D5P4Q1_9EURY|nr:hypothetical protein [Halosimplex rubrum]QLH78164.1 hypothetical protein HZS55_12990 [Halosimplex rubrum]
MSKESDNSREVVATEKKNMTDYGQVTFSKKNRPEDADSVLLRWFDDGTVQVEFLKSVPIEDSKSVVAQGGDE